MTDINSRAREAVRDDERIWIPPDDRMDLQPIRYDRALPPLATIEGLLRDGWRPGTHATYRLRMVAWRHETRDTRPPAA